ncbi:MAG: hypothetical protein OXM01_01785 [Gemmatimonadota bacterium]|nr:hypothetical protein [Gemmatimonadota bacterium]
MEIFLFWIAFAVVVGVIADKSKNRNGVGWALLSLLISPVLGLILVLCLPPGAADPKADAVRESNRRTRAERINRERES